MTHQVKRLIDKDALIASLQKIKERETNPLKYVLNYEERLVSEIIQLVESSPVEETLEDVLERLPSRLDLSKSVTNEGVKYWCYTPYTEAKRFYKSPIEAAQKLEKLLSRSPSP